MNNAYASIIEAGLVRGRLSAVQLYMEEVERKNNERKKAHTVPRTWMIWHGDRKVPYKSYLHYAPELGYWVCLKDNHGVLVFNSDAYCLASTCRMILMDKLYELKEDNHA